MMNAPNPVFSDSNARWIKCILLVALALLPRWVHGSPRVLSTLSLSPESSVDEPIPVAVDPQDGSVFVGGYQSGNILKVDPVTKRILAKAEGLRYLSVLRVAGGKLYAAAVDGGSQAVLSEYDVNLNLVRRLTSLNGWIQSFIVDAEAGKIYYGTSGRLCEVRLSDFSQRILYDFGEWIYCVSSLNVDPGRHRLYITLFDQSNAQAELLRFDLESETLLSRLAIGKNPVGYDNRYDSDRDGDSLFITQMYTSSITVVDVAENRVVKDIPHVSWPQRLAADPARHRLYVVDNYTDKFHILDTQSLELVKSLTPGDDPSGLCIDAARRRVYTANVWTRDIGVVDTAADALLERIPLAPASPLDLKIDSARNRLYVSNGSNGGVFEIDPDEARLARKINFYNYTTVDGLFDAPSGLMHVFTGEMVVLPDSNGDRIAYALDEFSQNIAALNLTTGRFVRAIAPDGAPSGVARDGNRVLFPYTVGGQLTLGIWDGSQILSYALGASDGGKGLGVNGSTRKCYVADYANHEVAVFDLASARLLKRVPVGQYPVQVAVDETANLVFISNMGSNTLSVIDGRDDTVQATIPVREAPWGLAVRPAAKRLYAVGSGANLLSVIDEDTLQEVAALPIGSGARYCAVDDRAGKVFVAAQSSATVTIIEDFVDRQPPVIECPSPIVVENADASGAIVRFSTPPVVDDHDPSPTVTLAPVSGSLFALGVTTVVVTAVDASGNRSACSFTVTVRRKACARPVRDLAAQSLLHRKILLTWKPSPDPGVQFYRVYMGRDAINFSQPAATLQPSATSWMAEDLANGATYKFVVRTLHPSGCEEENLNVVSATAYETPPCLAAVIKTPENGKKVSGERLTVKAEPLCEDSNDVRSVRFEYKRSSEDDAQWKLLPAANAEHPNPDEAKPFFVQWNVNALADGEYHLRAMAVDQDGNREAAPASITIRVDHSDPDSEESKDDKGKVRKVEKVENTKTNTVVIADENSGTPAQVQIPAGALKDEETKVTVKLNPDSVPPPDPKHRAAGSHLEIELANGQSQLQSEAVLSLPYGDKDSDGVVDGTGIRARDLRVFYFNPRSGEWEPMAGSTVDEEKKAVSAKTSHFSLFGLYAGESADPEFHWGEVYIYPNPSGRNRSPTFHIEAGLADGLDIRIYDLSGELVQTISLGQSPTVSQDRYVYEVPWDTRSVPSGVYAAVIRVKKQGQDPLQRRLRVAIVK